MDFKLDDIEAIKSYCKDWRSYDGSYFGYDFDCNSTMVEVYPDYVLKETFLENVPRSHTSTRTVGLRQRTSTSNGAGQRWSASVV